MTIFTQVNPESFLPATPTLDYTGKGCWNGLGFDDRQANGSKHYRLHLTADPADRIGTHADRSLSHWAVAAASSGVQRRLILLGHLGPVGDDEKGIWGPRTDAAFREFQESGTDPLNDDRALTVDGLLGKGDSAGLWTPVIDAAEKQFGIPDHILRGEIAHESGVLDPCAVGSFIYKVVKKRRSDGSYGTVIEFMGVDRGLCQINSRWNPQVTWEDAYNPAKSIPWSADRLRFDYDGSKKKYPRQKESVLWDAAICNHNNPSAANLWAERGGPPTEEAAAYVSAVRAAIY